MNKWLISALVIGVLAVVLGIFSYTIYKVYYTDDYDDGKTIFFIEKNGVVSKTKIDDMVDFTYQVEKPTMETNGWFLTIKVPFDFYEEDARDYEKSFV